MTLGKACPQSPALKKVTADASGFIALTPEGMAGTSQDLPAAETAVMAVAQGSIAARCFDDKLSSAAWAFKPLCIMATHDRMIQDFEFSHSLGPSRPIKRGSLRSPVGCRAE